MPATNLFEELVVIRNEQIEENKVRIMEARRAALEIAAPAVTAELIPLLLWAAENGRAELKVYSRPNKVNSREYFVFRIIENWASELGFTTEERPDGETISLVLSGW